MSEMSQLHAEATRLGVDVTAPDAVEQTLEAQRAEAVTMPASGLRVEASVLAYLIWDAKAGRWVIDPVSMDGYPLDFLVEPIVEAWDDDPGQGVETIRLAEADRVAAWEAGAPTGPELSDLLNDAI